MGWYPRSRQGGQATMSSRFIVEFRAQNTGQNLSTGISLFLVIPVFQKKTIFSVNFYEN
jgi:hypothetical protein